MRASVMVGDVTLRGAPRRGDVGVAECRERERQDAHGRAVAGVALEIGCGDAAFGEIAADAAPAGIADIDRARFQPGGEFLTEIARVEAAVADQGTAERKRHLGVVGDLPRGELEPAAADDPVVHAVACSDLALGHELDGCPERIADGEAEIGAECAIM